eukprot:1014230-Prorocentrum_minimum.AAC.2
MASNTCPDRQTVQNIFHIYADALRQLPTTSLPARRHLDAHQQAIIEKALTFHPKANSKIGCGVERIFVQRSRTPQGEEVCCFYVSRRDGSEEDFSLHKIYNRGYGHGFDVGTGSLRRTEYKHRQFN